jgi:hypothetical protein
MLLFIVENRKIFFYDGCEIISFFCLNTSIYRGAKPCIGLNTDTGIQHSDSENVTITIKGCTIDGSS